MNQDSRFYGAFPFPVFYLLSHYLPCPSKWCTAGPLFESHGLVCTPLPSSREGGLFSIQVLGLSRPGCVSMPSSVYSPPGLSLGLKANLLCFRRPIGTHETWYQLVPLLI